jgi:hypothetical protein
MLLVKGGTMSRSSGKQAKKPARGRAQRVLSRMRRTGKSAAREEHVDPRTVRKYFGKQLRKARRGRGYRITKADRERREMRSPTLFGMEPVTVRGSKQASVLGKYLAEVKKSLHGKPNALAKFEGKSVSGRALITDEDTLRELGQAGLLELDEIYAVPQASS